MLLKDTDRVIASMQTLKALGIGLSIDDFGTGFSSLSYIKMLPATKIKIDRAFINDVIRDRRDAAITRGVISMAHHLELKTVAEGVETEAQASFLRKHRCDTLQGFLYSRPIPLDALIDFMRNNAEKVESNKAAAALDGDQKTLLLLDDEENILKALTRVLRRDGYRILTAKTASEAFTQLAQNQVQVVVSDQRMPEISGTEFLSQVKSIYPDTIRIVLSGYTDLKSVTDAINQGNIYKFLTKPWDDGQIREQVAHAFLHYHAAKRD